MQSLVRRLNEIYRSESALTALDDRPEGFEWVDFHDAENTVWSFLRKAPNFENCINAAHDLLVVVNATPVVRHGYRIGVPSPGDYEEILNSDDSRYGGSGCFSNQGIHSQAVPSHGRSDSIIVDLPPLAVLVMRVP